VNPEYDDQGTRVLLSACVDAARVLVFTHVQDDTFAIIEEGEVSLSSSEGLKQLLQQLSGRTP
jgi:hypothetical protein